MFKNWINGNKHKSKFSYEVSYYNQGAFPPIVVITDLSERPTVLENLEEVTREIEKSLGKTIRFFPVVVSLERGPALAEKVFQVQYTDDSSDSFGASYKGIKYGYSNGRMANVRAAWCRNHLLPLSPDEVRERMASAALCAVASQSVRDGVGCLRQFDAVEQAPVCPRFTGAYTQFSDAARVAAKALWRIFYTAEEDCYAALKEASEQLDGYIVSDGEYLDAFLIALERRQHHPVILRDHNYPTKGHSTALEIYKNGITRPQSSY